MNPKTAKKLRRKARLAALQLQPPDHDFRGVPSNIILDNRGIRYHRAAHARGIYKQLKDDERSN